MKNLILVIGGAGFVGSNLIKHLIKNSKYKILSYDNYSTGLNSNHFKNSRAQYIKADTKNISNTIKAADQLNIFMFLGMLVFLVIGIVLVQFGDQLLPSIFRIPKAEYEEDKDKENPT